MELSTKEMWPLCSFIHGFYLPQVMMIDLFPFAEDFLNKEDRTSALQSKEISFHVSQSAQSVFTSAQGWVLEGEKG